ncbi:unnamed protein product, partial [marine sediment metagenome]
PYDLSDPEHQQIRNWTGTQFRLFLEATPPTVEFGPCGEVIIELVPRPPPVVELQDYRMN